MTSDTQMNLSKQDMFSSCCEPWKFQIVWWSWSKIKIATRLKFSIQYLVIIKHPVKQLYRQDSVFVNYKKVKYFN